ncbi:hypothetical protein AB1Y20_023314 [Prymnesium parvum]|uniref:Uncharacterized protein n=1 Tax=Prymnesium parvum TaxID=97485 RepID=A0AB34JF35_PRYPA|mmetsp:Transcript_14218/g.35476  ORF Transcript_14218/g.35476 Transcript_14218/m.35476 type:complete len:150 (-) Transcript_14218:292-741(-)
MVRDSVGPSNAEPTDSTDLVLEKDELEMLRIFHRSFNLPGLRLGLINPVCADDYFPTEETMVAHEEATVAHEPLEAFPAQLAEALPQQTAALLKRAEAVLNPTEEIDEEIQVSPVGKETRIPLSQFEPSGSRPHSRTVRSRPIRSAGKR